VLAEAGVAPLQVDLQLVRVLHVLRGLHLTASGQRLAGDLAKGGEKTGIFGISGMLSGSGYGCRRIYPD